MLEEQVCDKAGKAFLRNTGQVVNVVTCNSRDWDSNYQYGGKSAAFPFCG